MTTLRTRSDGDHGGTGGEAKGFRPRVSAGISLPSCELGAHLSVASCRVNRNDACGGLRGLEGPHRLATAQHPAPSEREPRSLLPLQLLLPGQAQRCGWKQGASWENDKQALEYPPVFTSRSPAPYPRAPRFGHVTTTSPGCLRVV